MILQASRPQQSSGNDILGLFNLRPKLKAWGEGIRKISMSGGKHPAYADFSVEP
jgi:hypothetical protein